MTATRAVLAAVVFLAAGCGGVVDGTEPSGDSARSPTTTETGIAGCRSGPGSPVTKHSFVSAMREAGYELSDDPCFSEGQEWVVSNVARDAVQPGDEYHAIVAEQGHISCIGYDGAGFGEHVERHRFEGDEETSVHARNIRCLIYPGGENASGQIDRLAEAFEAAVADP